METREIKDAEGNVIISITLPEGTPDEKWQEALSAYIIEE